MIFVNEFGKLEKFSREIAEIFVKLLAPYAPHACEEMWDILGNKETLAYEPWPQFNEKYLKEDEVEILIQVLGKAKARINMSPEISQEEMKNIALANPTVAEAIKGKTIRKVICVPGRLVNIVAN